MQQIMKKILQGHGIYSNKIEFGYKASTANLSNSDVWTPIEDCNQLMTITKTESICLCQLIHMEQPSEEVKSDSICFIFSFKQTSNGNIETCQTYLDWGILDINGQLNTLLYEENFIKIIKESIELLTLICTHHSSIQASGTIC